MTQDEKLIARLKSLESGLYTIYVAVVDGKIVFWVAPESIGSLEGFPKPLPAE
jgi:hypothetical protein